MEVTAPGKVLLLGGYAVLEGHPALSIAMADGKGHGADAEVKEGAAHRIVSREFGIDSTAQPGSLRSRISSCPRAHRVAVAAHSAALAYLEARGLRPKPVTIELSNSPMFGGKDEKSGLGSSAASTVALVAALFEANGLPLEGSREEAHKLSQIAHAIATDRVGSGFDIATSAYGSIEYVRYKPEALSGAAGDMDDEAFGARLKDAVSAPWPGMSVKPCPLEGFSLLCFNVKGSKTSTVSSVKAVRAMAGYLPELYSTLLGGQAEAEAAVLEGLRKKEPERIRAGMRKAREAQRMMSAWVRRVGMMGFDDIEPEPLRKVIDDAEGMDGIVAGRCPGSGGYDSLAFIVSGDADSAAGKIAAAGKAAGVVLERIDAAATASGVRRTG